MFFKRLTPRSIFITGASSGIGRALAQQYAAPEITLFLCGRSFQRLNETAATCQGKGATVHTYVFDVNNPAEVTAAVQDAFSTQTPPDLIIANAGVSGGVLGTTETPSTTRSIMQTNITGVVNTVLPTVELIKKSERFGHIAILSSIAGYRGMPSCPAYSASKACVKAWGEALRGFLKRDKIAVTVICPGFIETPLTDANQFRMPLLMKADRAARIIQKRLSRNPAIIAFPWPMVLGAWFGSCLPSWIISPILAQFPKKEKMEK